MWAGQNAGAKLKQNGSSGERGAGVEVVGSVCEGNRERLQQRAGHAKEPLRFRFSSHQILLPWSIRGGKRACPVAPTKARFQPSPSSSMVTEERPQAGGGEQKELAQDLQEKADEHGSCLRQCLGSQTR